jgi:hypothetical protein
MSDENWDLTPLQHLDRADELLEVIPVAGDVIEHHLQVIYLAARHSTLAVVKYGRSTIGSSSGSDNLDT